MNTAKLTRDQLKVRQMKAKRALEAQRRQVLICAGTGCIAGGSLNIYERMKEECQRRGLNVHVGLLREDETPETKSDDINLKRSGCHGFCEMGPLLQIEPDGILYTHVQVEDCDDIIEQTLLRGKVIPRLLYQLDGVTYEKHEDIPFYHKQHRIVLENCGTTDAEDIDEYLAKDGYSAFEKALFEMTDEAICKEILDSGLRGRGGGGFPAGRKWESVRQQPKGKKYVVCNGDEGDPGAFMDRSIMEGNPHSIIEGMLIAGVAAGSDEGYIYVRAEYPPGRIPPAQRHRPGGGAGPAGRPHPGYRLLLPSPCKPGRRRLRLRRGQCPDSFHRGQPGHASGQAAPDHRARSLGRAHGAEQCGDFCQRALIIRKGVDWYRSIGTKTSPRHQGLRADRQRGEYRPH